jgi:putative peptide zinc metalloprotease protein
VIGIVLVLWSNPKYLTLGAVLAVIAGAMWVIWPFLKSIGFVLTSPALMGRRVRAVTICLVFSATLIGVLGLIPMPAAGYATGTVEPRIIEPLRPLEDGFIQIVHVRPGDFVNKGDPIFTMYNAEIMADVESSRALVDGAQTQVDALIGGDQTDRVLAESRLRQLQRALAHAEDRAASLVVRAKAAGHVVPAAGLGPDMDRLLGGFFSRGSLLATVASTDDLIVRCVVPDREAGYIFRGNIDDAVEGVEASIRVHGRAGDEIDAKVERHAPAGSRQITAESLTNIAGGEVIADPNDPHKATVVPHWLVEVSPQAAQPELLKGWKPGLRARVRFGVASEPLLEQWLRRARQYLADKAEA